MASQTIVEAKQVGHGSERRHGETPSFLWVDLTRHSSGIFDEIGDLFRSHDKILDTRELQPAILSRAPAFVCFEYDYPEKVDRLVLQEITYRHPFLRILILTEHHSEELAVWAFRIGVRDYFVKPTAGDALRGLIRALLVLAKNAATLPIPFSHDRASPDIVAFPGRGLAHRTVASIGYVAENYATKITEAATAGRCHMSCSQFSRRFKHEHGITFREYLAEYRIRRACELLTLPAACVKDVAFSVGFTDLSYFARTFRCRVGMTPSKFKTSHGIRPALVRLGRTS